MRAALVAVCVTAVTLSAAHEACADPIGFDLVLTDTDANVSIGSFTVDSDVLTDMPATGLYLSSSSLQAVTSMNIAIGGVVFDLVPATSGVGASDGASSGVTGIYFGNFTASAMPGWFLQIQTKRASPFNWYVHGDGEVQYAGGPSWGAGGYTISLQSNPVPEPGTLALLSLGVLGLAYQGRVRRRSRRGR